MAHPTFYRTTRIGGLTIFYKEAGPPRANASPSTKTRTRLGICSREALTAELQRIPTDPHCPKARKNDHGEITCSPKLARVVADGARSAGADVTVKRDWRHDIRRPFSNPRCPSPHPKEPSMSETVSSTFSRRFRRV